MAGHRIRLAGPWDLRNWTTDSSPSISPTVARRFATQNESARKSAAATRFQLPLPLNPNAFPESAQFLQPAICRRFHCPTGMSDRTEVRLIWECSVPDLVIRLNATPLGEVSILRSVPSFLCSAQIRPLLQAFNELAVRLPESNSENDLAVLFSVSLEIEELE